MPNQQSKLTPEGRIAGKPYLLCSVLAFVCLALGLPVTVVSLSSLCHSLKARDCWVSTPCEVLQVEAEEIGYNRSQITLRYRYSVDGISCSGQRYSWGTDTFNTQRANSLAQAIRQAPAHQTCYVNPEAPQESVFDVQVLWLTEGVGLFAGAGFSVVGLALFVMMGYSLWWGKKPHLGARR